MGTAFAASAARNSDRMAVQCGQDALTYRELAELTGAVARGLTTFTEPDQDSGIVAVLLDRSIEFVATLIGTVAAGMTYVPIDPASPDEYVEELLDQLRPVVVVAAPDRIGQNCAGSPRRVTVAQLTAAGDAASASVEPGPEAPAYVIFTSGSTGTPKGVVVAHRSLLNSTQARLLAYDRPERIPLLHSVAFDVASGVVFYALLGGGTLIVNPMPLSDVASAVKLVRDERITHLVYAASLYPVFLERISADPPLTLAAVMIGSERWSEVLIDRHAQLLPHTSLYNEYGPTEACVFSSYARVYCGVSGQRFALTIGMPLINTGYVLLDDTGAVIESAPGAIGELAITGPNVAIGYLARPELTADRFIELPNEVRAYRTGDLVEITADGQFVFLGRGDRQIKIQGNRVEPGHVETALMTHPGVEQAYVSVRTDLGADTTLVGYLVPAADSGMTVDQARAHLAIRLPHYMIPTAWMIVEGLPRTANGKIDERNLPRPGAPVRSAATAVDEIERILVEMVADVTSAEVIAVDADLRGFGLTSLSHVRLSAAISARFDIEIPMSVLFAASDVREIATHVRRAAPIGRPALMVTDRDSNDAPLSAQQRQIWILHHLAPSVLAYNTQCTLELTGELDVGMLKMALTDIVERHEILRTTFHDGPQGPVQRVHSPWQVRIEQVDLSTMGQQTQRSALAAHKQAAMGSGFDIAALPLVRWCLYRLSQTRWQLFQVEHHFVHDGWSATLLLAEIRDAYDAEQHARPNPRPGLPVQYRDYAHWYGRWRDTDHYRRQQQYWASTLEGCSPVGVSFEPDRPRPPVQTFEGGCVRVGLTHGVVSAIDAACTRHGVTRFAVFLSAFALLVWRHTNESDMVIGSALSNRRQAETASLLGMFVNALPLRLRVEESATVGTVVHGVMQVLLGAQDNQEFPLVDLVEALNLVRDPARNALFGLMFAFHDNPRPRFELDGLRGELRIDHNGSAKNDVNVVCVPEMVASADGSQRVGIDILWEYNSALFDPATAQEHAAQFAHIVASITDHWDTPINTLDLLGPVMTRRILTSGTGPDSTPAFTTITDGIDHAITRAPDAIALIQGEHQITYRELDELVAQFETVLAQFELGTDATIAVAYGKSVELVAAWLAVLRRGAAYITVDPTQPRMRLLTLVQNSAAAAVLCASEAVAAFRGCGVPVICPDQAVASPIAPPLPAIQPDAPAYLTFTSGSTGTPKAVVATHANAVAAIHARTVEFGWTPPRTLVTLPPIFDVAASMVLWTLWLGGTVVFSGDDTTDQDPDGLCALIDTYAVTHLNFVSSFYSVFLDSLENPWATSLRVVAVGGEPCTSELVRRHAQLLGEVGLYNEYGPTEATVWTSVARVHPRARTSGAHRISIGHPVANSSMFVLDPRGQLAPIGARGELVIGGAGVSAGYFGRPELTCQRFAPIAVGPMAGARAYRTGDVARVRPDGEFEILGRLDDQIKVRGFRIETGEVTRCLTEHPAVTSAFVALHVVAGTPQMAAFVAAPGHDHALVTALQRWLGERLPAYMVPSVYAVVDELPRTRIGKIDRNRMPTPTGPPAVTEEAEHTDPAQHLLLELWRTLLGRRDITIDDDFFAVGGDSLLAIRAVTLARSHGLNLSVPTVLRARTIRAISENLVLEPIAADRPRRAGGAALALSGIQGWFFAQGFADPDQFQQVRLFEIDPSTSDLDLVAAIESTVARHDAFRTVFTEIGEQWRAQLLDVAPAPAVEVVALSAFGGAEVSVRAHLASMSAQLSIRAGRLWRIALCNEAWSGRRWLCLVLHHLIVDAVSWDILVRDIESSHHRQSGGAAAADHLVAAAGVPERISLRPSGTELDYWKELANRSAPIIAADSVDRSPYGALRCIERTLSPLARRLMVRELPLMRGPGGRAVLLAALARGLKRTSGEPLYVLLEGHGRDHLPGAEEIVGWLTALYPVFLPIGDHAELLDDAQDVERHLADVPAHGANYGIARYLEPTSALGTLVAGIAEPAVTFNYLGQRSSSLPTDVLTPVAVETGFGIGPANVLPTPLDITVIDTGQTIVVRCALDPARADASFAEAVLDAMIDAIEQTAATVPLGGGPDRPNHFLMHPVDGTISWAHPLASRPGAPWRWIGLPQSEPHPNTTVAELAEEYCTRIRRIQPYGPYTITGWSFGAAVAFEMARQFEDSDDRVTLTLIDPPSTQDGADDAASLTGQLHRLLPWSTSDEVASAVADMAELAEPERVSALVQRLAGADLGIEDRSLLERQIDVLLANRAALAAWRPVGQVEAVTVVMSQDTDAAGLVDVGLWRQHTRTEVRLEVVPGDHFSMMSGDGLTALSDLLDGRSE
ncbi:amino acid adenylation domain-containing protein [Nocardia sp. NBC_00565]|uniref:amino acid adenylation domain-containing protein n=1 Tax=Nocardia sp. NBC_00565 TaxID=2975993 RepID=UPI002E80C15F|nr:amino acid adenylation domain-containing protein [Nocardia sp. NBC_00565]WUC07504.1 amino acid adenylation domain-containing protein [Nocardia sp. NBC_00565]